MYYNKKKMAVSMLWVFLGAGLLALELTGILTNPIYSGLGGGWLAVGMMQIFRNVKYHSDEAYRENIDIASKDERNGYLRMKAWSWAGYLFIFGAAIVSLVLFLAGQNLYGQIVSYCMCAVLALYWIAYSILQRKY